MEASIQKLVAICFMVIGLSHIIRPRVWAQLFIMFRDKGEAGSFLSGLLHFPLGALVVSFHNVWHGIPLVVTLVGWGLLIKGLIYLTYTKHGMRMLGRVSIERSWEFTVAGFVSVALGVLIILPLIRQ
ncbi:MAG TPA: hypothetical protein VGX92_20095 [Pyrinomonadaceae bacterium]|nr:hypothetical protein [Pyrinomonadaceae bacterium]